MGSNVDGLDPCNDAGLGWLESGPRRPTTPRHRRRVGGLAPPESAPVDLEGTADDPFGTNTAKLIDGQEAIQLTVNVEKIHDLLAGQDDTVKERAGQSFDVLGPRLDVGISGLLDFLK